jgi:hypothetical protein
LRLSLVLGLLIAGFAMIYGLVLITCRALGEGMFGQPVVVGYTSTIVSVLFLGGIQLISMGVLGEYIGRIYDEVKRRPLFFINRIHGSPGVERAGSREEHSLPGPDHWNGQPSPLHPEQLQLRG